VADSQVCDVTCDVTLASMPLQVLPIDYNQGQLARGQNRSIALRVCNLLLLILILPSIARRTVTAEAAGSSPVVPAIPAKHWRQRNGPALFCVVVCVGNLRFLPTSRKSLKINGFWPSRRPADGLPLRNLRKSATRSMINRNAKCPKHTPVEPAAGRYTSSPGRFQGFLLHRGVRSRH